MGLIGDALLQSANFFGGDSYTIIFLGVVFLTVFCGFSTFIIAFALNGKAEKNILPN
tara:strand:- start:74 stop:244 length:171 start_codon:yes stop_codon:yes gene_type:complete